jgi:hypothetical protein
MQPKRKDQSLERPVFIFQKHRGERIMKTLLTLFIPFMALTVMGFMVIASWASRL